MYIHCGYDIVHMYTLTHIIIINTHSLTNRVIPRCTTQLPAVVSTCVLCC